MLFNFTLVPLERVQPWGSAGKQLLHWFGLTDGQYWLEVGSETLLEYTERFRSEPGARRYCNYQVVRLYEDLLEMVPYVLEAVPASLVPYLSGDSGKEWEAKSASWWTANLEDAPEEDEFWSIADASATWIGSRKLDTGYLSPSSDILMWSDTSTVHIEWDNRDKLIDGCPAWTALHGSFHLPREIFKEEVRSFHSRLMEQMGERVERVLAGALPTEMEIDLPGLQREHAFRCRSIEAALAGPPVPTNWEYILESIHKIERGAYGPKGVMPECLSANCALSSLVVRN